MGNVTKGNTIESVPWGNGLPSSESVEAHDLGGAEDR